MLHRKESSQHSAFFGYCLRKVPTFNQISYSLFWENRNFVLDLYSGGFIFLEPEYSYSPGTILQENPSGRSGANEAHIYTYCGMLAQGKKCEASRDNRC
jgi:hypothetical protein